MINKWKTLKKEVKRHSPFRAIEDVTFEMPNGDEKIFSLKKEGVVVAIMAIDKKGQVILTRQYRPGPDQVLDELAGGGVEKGESPLSAAKRELEEESGYTSEQWIELGTPLECAYSTIKRHAFLALDCEETTEQKLDESEYIEVVLKSKRDFFEQIKKGNCTDPEVGWMGLFEIGFIKDGY